MSHRAEALMGTMVTIDAPAALVDRAFDWFRAVEQICSRFDPHSELCRLSTRPGEAVAVSTVLLEAVHFAVHVAAVTGGAFDPTVGAAMQGRGFNREHRTRAVLVPTLDARAGAGHSLIDGGADSGESSAPPTYRDVEIDSDRQTITLRQPLLLDLGAVAKGLAIDLAARELRTCGSFAIDAGGDLYLGGSNSRGDAWSIGIRHPRHAGETIASVRVRDRAVCTSGDYERVAGAAPARGDGDRHTAGGAMAGHHIIDPRTGTSPVTLASVTVIAESAMLADALATAAFVLGPRDGLELVETMGVEALLVTSDLEQIRTAGWPDA